MPNAATERSAAQEMRSSSPTLGFFSGPLGLGGMVTEAALTPSRPRTSLHSSRGSCSPLARSYTVLQPGLYTAVAQTTAISACTQLTEVRGAERKHRPPSMQCWGPSSAARDAQAQPPAQPALAYHAGQDPAPHLSAASITPPVVPNSAAAPLPRPKKLSKSASGSWA